MTPVLHCEFDLLPPSLLRSEPNSSLFVRESKDTMGGLEGNTKAEIVDKSGKPISGLFASGEVGELNLSNLSNLDRD